MRRLEIEENEPTGWGGFLVFMFLITISVGGILGYFKFDEITDYIDRLTGKGKYSVTVVDQPTTGSYEEMRFDTMLKDAVAIKIDIVYQNSMYSGPTLANKKAEIRRALRIYFADYTAEEVYKDIPKHIDVAMSVAKETDPSHDFLEIKMIHFPQHVMEVIYRKREALNQVEHAKYVAERERIDAEVMELKHINKMRRLELEEIERKKQLDIERYEKIHNAETQKALEKIAED